MGASLPEIRKILVANRSEIAIRVFRAANELGIKTVAVFSEEDKLALHRFKADEAYLIGHGPHLERPLGPIEAYLSIPEILRVAERSGADADPPGLRLPLRKPGIRRSLRRCRHHLHRPVAARRCGGSATRFGARAGGLRPACRSCRRPIRSPTIRQAWKRLAEEIGYPLMLKASWGGGGRGMRVVRDAAALSAR